MKTWIMMRHGKSSWTYPVSDLDRPLSERGINDAHRMGVFLSTKELKVDAAFTSPAIRAAHTALIVTKELALPVHKLSISPNLYDFGGDDVLEFIHCLPETYETVITFGHNDACTRLACKLAGFEGTNIPTAGIVFFRFDVSLWSSIHYGEAKYYTPKMH